MAIGEESQAKANSSLALGAGAKVTVENSVSLGADSYADEIGGQAEMTINGCTYTFAGQQAQGTVVRTITVQVECYQTQRMQSMVANYMQ